VPAPAPEVILIAADPHGRIPLLLKLALAYQRDTGERVGQVLVCGDMGIFPDDRRVDAATRRFARRFPEEFGFRAFEPMCKVRQDQPQPRLVKHLRKAKRLVETIREDLDAPLYFIGGNHEDYAYLERCQRLAGDVDVVPIERSGQLLWLAQSSIVELETCLGPLTVAGLSGIDPAGSQRNPDKLTDGSILDDDEVLALLEAAGGRPVDLLLTHDSAEDVARPGWGSAGVALAVRELDPRFHFWGHEHVIRPPMRYADLESAALTASRSQGILINKLDTSSGTLEPNSLGVLRRGEDGELAFEFVDEAWLRRVTPHNWAHI
jgi:hypothetical protein